MTVADDEKIVVTGFVEPNRPALPETVTRESLGIVADHAACAFFKSRGRDMMSRINSRNKPDDSPGEVPETQNLWIQLQFLGSINYCENKPIVGCCPLRLHLDANGFPESSGCR